MRVCTLAPPRKGQPYVLTAVSAILGSNFQVLLPRKAGKEVSRKYRPINDKTHPFPTAYFDPIILHIKWHLFENVIILIDPNATCTLAHCYTAHACMPSGKLRKKIVRRPLTFL